MMLLERCHAFVHVVPESFPRFNVHLAGARQNNVQWASPKKNLVRRTFPALPRVWQTASGGSAPAAALAITASQPASMSASSAELKICTATDAITSFVHDPGNQGCALCDHGSTGGMSADRLGRLSTAVPLGCLRVGCDAHWKLLVCSETLG